MSDTVNGLTYRESGQISPEERLAVYQKLLAYNLAHLDDKFPHDLGIFLEDAMKNMIGALIGVTHGHWLKVDYLWVDTAFRGKTLGSQLLKRAETTAVARGCKQVLLDTFDFQAPHFYEKLGYKQVFVLEDYPRTGKRHYYIKALQCKS